LPAWRLLQRNAMHIFVRRSLGHFMSSRFKSACQSCWIFISTRTPEWWTAAFTFVLVLATIALFIATGALVTATDNLAAIEKEHGVEEWRKVVNATVGELIQAINATPSRHVCAKYVIAVDGSHGITAQKAGELAHARSKFAPDTIPMRLDLSTTSSLLDAVLGATPLDDDYDFGLSDKELAPLAKACLSTLGSEGSATAIASKDRAVIVSQLNKELIGYQNAVEAAAGLPLRSELPEPSLKFLVENLEGAFDADTRLFLEATAVYGYFRELKGDRPTADRLDKDLKDRAAEDFRICQNELKNEGGEEVGKCFKQEYGSKPFLTPAAEVK
jgi:hypothetical protein